MRRKQLKITLALCGAVSLVLEGKRKEDVMFLFNGDGNVCHIGVYDG